MGTLQAQLCDWANFAGPKWEIPEQLSVSYQARSDAYTRRKADWRMSR